MKSWPRSTVSLQGERPSLPSKPTSATVVNPGAPGDALDDPPSGVITGRQQAAAQTCRRRVTGERGQRRSSATGLIRSRAMQCDRGGCADPADRVRIPHLTGRKALRHVNRLHRARPLVKSVLTSGVGVPAGRTGAGLLG